MPRVIVMRLHFIGGNIIFLLFLLLAFVMERYEHREQKKAGFNHIFIPCNA